MLFVRETTILLKINKVLFFVMAANIILFMSGAPRNVKKISLKWNPISPTLMISSLMWFPSKEKLATNFIVPTVVMNTDFKLLFTITKVIRLSKLVKTTVRPFSWIL